MHTSAFIIFWNGSYGRCAFNIFKNYQTLFQNGCTILHVRCGNSSSCTSPVTVGISVFLILATLIYFWWYIIVVLIYRGMTIRADWEPQGPEIWKQRILVIVPLDAKTEEKSLELGFPDHKCHIVFLTHLTTRSAFLPQPALYSLILPKMQHGTIHFYT